MPAISQSLIVSEEKTPSAIASKFGWAFDEYAGKAPPPNYRSCLSVTSRAAKLSSSSELFDQQFYDLLIVGGRQRIHVAQSHLVLQNVSHHGFEAHAPSYKKRVRHKINLK